MDIAILIGDNLPSGMHAQQVAKEGLFVVGLPGSQGEVDLRQLDGVRLVRPARPNSLRTLFDCACTERGAPPQVVTEASSPYTMVQLVRAGLGAAVLPLSMSGGSRPLGSARRAAGQPGAHAGDHGGHHHGCAAIAALLAVDHLVLSIFEQQAGSSE